MVSASGHVRGRVIPGSVHTLPPHYRAPPRGCLLPDTPTAVGLLVALILELGARGYVATTRVLTAVEWVVLTKLGG